MPDEQPEPSVASRLADADARRAARWSPRRLAIVGGIALVVIAIAGGIAVALSGREPSADATYAAASNELGGGQILHWQAKQEQTNAASSRLGAHIRTTVDQWADLGSGATHVIVDSPDAAKADPSVEDNFSRLESWDDGVRTRWTIGSPTAKSADDRIRVDRVTSKTATPRDQLNTPVDQLRRVLADAMAGHSTLKHGDDWHGTSVLEVTKVTRDAGRTATAVFSIVEAKNPWLLKTVATTRDDAGKILTRTTTTTTTWTLFPGTNPAARKNVDHPDFSSARYAVSSTRLQATPGG